MMYNTRSDRPPSAASYSAKESDIENQLIKKLQGLKYEYCQDITNRAKLEQNFRQKFEALNRVRLTDAEFARLLDEIVVADVFTASKTLRGIKGQYLETAKKLKDQQGKTGGKDQTGDGTDDPVEQLDFEFVLFATAVIDYDYIMGLIAKFSAKGPGKSKMTREELIGLISADAKFMNERETIAEYIGTLKAGEGLSEAAIREGYTRFKAEKNTKELADIAARHGLATTALQSFVDGILGRMIFDGEHLSDLMAPLELGWKARTQAELALMADLCPLLTKRAAGRDISRLSAYEQ